MGSFKWVMEVITKVEIRDHPNTLLGVRWPCKKAKEANERKQCEMLCVDSLVVPLSHSGIVSYWAHKHDSMKGFWCAVELRHPSGYVVSQINMGAFLERPIVSCTWRQRGEICP